MRKMIAASVVVIIVGTLMFMNTKQESDLIDTIRSEDVRDVVKNLENGVYDNVNAAAFSTHIEVNVEGEQILLYDEEDMFYISFAPYINTTHTWYTHSLTGCRGELQNEEMYITIVNEDTGEEIISSNVVTYNNGFIGFWLPRNINASINIEYDNKAGQFNFSTTNDSPTCITVIELT